MAAWQGIEAPKQTIKFPNSKSFFSLKKWIKLILKTIGNRKKRLCMRLRSEDKHHLWKSADRKSTKLIRKAFVPLTGLICAFEFADFLRWCLSSERILTHNLFFLFPIVFSINILTYHFLVTCNFSQPPLVSHHSATINLVFSRVV